jgi:hypothetical protein
LESLAGSSKTENEAVLRILTMVGSATRSDLFAEEGFFLELEDARRVSTPRAKGLPL